MKRTRTINRTLTYSLDGKFPTSHPNKVMFLADQSFETKPITDKKEYTEKRFHNLPGSDLVNIQSIDSVLIDGMPGFAITAKAREPDQLVYMVMLYPNEKHYFMMYAVSEGVGDSYVSVFANMAKSFKRKK